MIGWLTTVTPDGQPQTFPIWFLWDDGEMLVYSDRRAKRNAQHRRQPAGRRCTSTTTGAATTSSSSRARRGSTTRRRRSRDNAAYLAKYGDWIRDEF